MTGVGTIAKIYIGRNETQLGSELASGEVSAPITLIDGNNRIVVEISSDVNIPGFRYTLDLDFDAPLPPRIVRDIVYVEDLAAINNDSNTLRGVYTLTRHLDFNDPSSYRSGAVNRDWLVDEGEVGAHLGWTAIGQVHHDPDSGQPQGCSHPASECFSGIFDGNGFTLSNMQISSDLTAQGARRFDNRIALFGALAQDAVVRDLGLLNTRISVHQTDDPVQTASGLVQVNYGTIIGSYVAGNFSGSDVHAAGLVADNYGDIINSHAAVIAAEGIRSFAGLVSNNDGLILNSHAGTIVNSKIAQVARGAGVAQAGNAIGGLVANNAAEVLNSYAEVNLDLSSRQDFVGGLVASAVSGSVIENAYVTGLISAVGGNDIVGGIVAASTASTIGSASIIRNTYTVSEIVADASTNKGGIIGSGSATDQMISSYALSDEAHNPDLGIGIGSTIANSSTQTSTQLRAGLAQSTDVDAAYYDWDSNNWDFGNTIQYPILRYAQSTGTDVLSACGSSGLPDCGEPIAPQIHNGLQDLTLAGDDALSPLFADRTQQNFGSYLGIVHAERGAIRLIPTAHDPNATITLYQVDGTGRTTIGNPINSGTISAAISLQPNALNHIIVEVDPSITGQATVEYPLYLQYTPQTVVTIDSLEDLNAIRNNPNGSYALARNLDFMDDDSYDDPANKALWTVDDFDEASDRGWLPISDVANPFGGIFDGNGFVISNLQINRDDADRQGLFGRISHSGIVRNLGLRSVTVQGQGRVAALVGENRGRIRSSYAIGEVSATDTVGGLVGAHLEPGWLINSYAVVDVSGISRVGGLVGVSEATVINAYAIGNVSAQSFVGGLVGVQSDGVIYNSYANGDVFAIAGANNEAIGGFAGLSDAGGEIVNSYATGAVDGNGGNAVGGFVGRLFGSDTVRASYSIGSVSGGGASDVGGLIGAGSGSVLYSYWDVGTSNQAMSASGSGRSTRELQTPTSAINIYINWSADSWDFGSPTQYPVLKYAQLPGIHGVQVCDGDGLPNCSDLITPQLQQTLLQNITSANGELSPAFNPSITPYIATIFSAADIRLIATVSDVAAEVRFYLVDANGRTQVGDVYRSGAIAAPLTLDATAINQIIVEIKPSAANAATVEYSVYLRYRDFAPIVWLEDLDAIRIHPHRNYILMRDLDFAADASYRDPSLKAFWTVADFSDRNDTGWVAIGDATTPFTGTLDGNGYTLSGLQINDDRATDKGLFGVVGASAVIRNLGILAARIEDGNTNFSLHRGTGILAGRNDGRIIASHTHGTVDGATNKSGFVGINAGEIINSHALAAVSHVHTQSARGYSGGLTAANTGLILNSHFAGTLRHEGGGSGSATGALAGISEGKIRNSYATVDLEAIGQVGGLVGRANDLENGYVAGINRGNAGGAFSGNLVGISISAFTLDITTATPMVPSNGMGSTPNATPMVPSDGMGSTPNATPMIPSDGMSSTPSATATTPTAPLVIPDGLGSLDIGTAASASVIASYSIVNSERAAAGLVGVLSGTLARSYSNSDRASLPIVGNTYQASEVIDSFTANTAALQAGSAQNDNPEAPYYEWNSDDWDFGNDDQYPVLKYTQNPNINSVSRGGSRACDGVGLPACGSLIASEPLSVLRLAVAGSKFNPPFDLRYRDYVGVVESGEPTIRLVAVAKNPMARITFVSLDADGNETARSNPFIGSATSAEMMLDEDDAIQVAVEVITPGSAGSAGGVDRYNMSLSYVNVPSDSDGNTYVLISTLEELNAIRDDPDASYLLIRHLDFSDDASYANPELNKATWTVSDFDSSSDNGWTPIGDATTPFSGEFNGNGYTISGLQINRATDNQGLFGTISSDGAILNLGLLAVNIQAAGNVGALAGSNAGTVISSYAVGEITASADNVGGLFGMASQGSPQSLSRAEVINSHVGVYIEGRGSNLSNYGGLIGQGSGAVAIINSRAYGEIVGDITNAGGLIGLIGDRRLTAGTTLSTVVNSYAAVGIDVFSRAGGLIGASANTSIVNSYAMGSVAATGMDYIIPGGGLVGSMTNTTLANSYAISAVAGAGTFIGGFVGLSVDSGITASYWDLQTSGQSDGGAGSGAGLLGLNTADLQSPTAPNASSPEVYTGWSTDNWNFGTATEYPILRHTQNPHLNGTQTCDVSGLPDCGSLIEMQIRNGLQDLQLVEGGLTPSFTEGNHRYHGIYFGEAYGTPIRLIPTARQADATINIYVGTVKDKESNPDQTITSGAISAPIAIAEGVNRIVVEVVGTPTVRHPLYIRYQREASDRNNNGFTEIYDLDELDAIRNAPDGKYELVRDLDFNDPGSYALKEINRNWVVTDFDNTTNTGWIPIGNATTPFTGEFNGNGFTISALRINRNGEDDQGLFGSIGSGGMVSNLGVPNVRIAGGNRVGALVGNNAGTVLNGSMVGAISGDDDVGGLVGNNSGAVFNSDALGTVAAANRVGGLVGNNAGQIINSYSDVAVSATAAAAGGLVGNCDNCTMLNSFALGSVTGVGSDADTIGGFVGRLEGRVNVSNNYARGDVRGGDITNGDGNGGFLSYADIEDIAQFNANYSVGATDAGFGGNNINVISDVSGTAPNYWNDDTDGSNAASLAALNASRQTTEQLQRPRSNTGIYARWSRSNWDFGTRNQYPILKYTQNPDNDDVRICDADGLPNCGDLIAPQVRPVLQDVRLVEGTLTPPFDEQQHWLLWCGWHQPHTHHPDCA